MSILNLPILSRIRRNHGLEHATLSLLAQRFPNHRMAGYSYPGGFFLLGDVPTEHVREVVVEALARMNNGEKSLAFHPNCGTNYVVSGILAGTLAWLGMVGARSKRDRFERLPLVIILATLGLIFSAPLGLKVQEYVTTCGDPQGLSVVDIFPIRFGQFSLHRVITQG
jgi:hypothetical protein